MQDSYTELQKRWGAPKALYAKAIQLFAHFTGIKFAYLFLRPIQGNSVPPPMPEGYTRKVLTADELRDFVGQSELELTQEFLGAAAQRGDLCLAAFKGRDLVSYVWRGYNAMPIQEHIQLNFSHPIRYGYKALTLKDHRGLRIQNSLALPQDLVEADQGYQYGLSYIGTENYSSIASDKVRGSIVIGLICWGSNRFAKICFTTPGARKREIFLSKS